jgi:hypothetical protein
MRRIIITTSVVAFLLFTWVLMAQFHPGGNSSGGGSVGGTYVFSNSFFTGTMTYSNSSLSENVASNDGAGNSWQAGIAQASNFQGSAAGLTNVSELQLDTSMGIIRVTGAAHNGLIFTNVNITNGNTSMTIPATSVMFFNAGMVGQNVELFGASSTFPNQLSTTISAYVNTTNVTLAGTPTQTSAITTAYIGTDDTPVIQAAIGLAYSNQLGKIMLPPGVYFIDGPFISMTNTTTHNFGGFAQLVLPQIDPTNSMAQTIGLYGSEVPFNATAWNVGTQLQLPTNGTVFLTGRIPTNNPATNCCLLGIPNKLTNFAFDFSALKFVCDSIYFRTYNNPSTSPLNLAFVGCCKLNNIICDVGTNQGSTGQPTNSYAPGIKFPTFDNLAEEVTGDHLTCIGYFFGCEIAEHVNIGNLYCCEERYGIVLDGGNHNSHIDRYLAQAVQYAIVVASPVLVAHIGLTISLYDYEHDSGGPSWTGYSQDISDPSSYWAGDIWGAGWNGTSWGSAITTGGGATNLTIHYIATGAVTQAGTITAAHSIGSSYNSVNTGYNVQSHGCTNTTAYNELFNITGTSATVVTYNGAGVSYCTNTFSIGSATMSLILQPNGFWTNSGTVTINGETAF